MTIYSSLVFKRIKILHTLHCHWLVWHTFFRCGWRSESRPFRHINDSQTGWKKFKNDKCWSRYARDFKDHSFRYHRARVQTPRMLHPRLPKELYTHRKITTASWGSNPRLGCSSLQVKPNEWNELHGKKSQFLKRWIHIACWCAPSSKKVCLSSTADSHSIRRPIRELTDPLPSRAIKKKPQPHCRKCGRNSKWKTNGYMKDFWNVCRRNHKRIKLLHLVIPVPPMVAA